MKKIIALVLALMMMLPVVALGENVVKIGVFEPASGDSGAGGKQEMLGMQYANKIQPTVEIGGETYNVELVYADNGSSADKAPSAAQQLVSEGVSVVLGSYGSGVSIAGSPIFAQAGIPASGYLRIGAGDADGGDASLLEDERTGDGHAAAVGAEHNAHALADQLLSSRGSLVGRGAIVSINQFNIVGLAADFNGGANLVGILHAQHFLLAASAAVAGSGLEHADFHHIFAQRDRGQEHHHSQKNSNDLFHHELVPPVTGLKNVALIIRFYRDKVQ